MKALWKPSAVVGNLFPVVSVSFMAAITTNIHRSFLAICSFSNFNLILRKRKREKKHNPLNPLKLY